MKQQKVTLVIAKGADMEVLALQDGIPALVDEVRNLDNGNSEVDFVCHDGCFDEFVVNRAQHSSAVLGIVVGGR